MIQRIRRAKSLLLSNMSRTVLAALLLFGAAAELASESVTLNTYYPAPSGAYQKLITTAQTHLARDGNVVHIGANSAAGTTGIDMHNHTIINGPTSAGAFTAAGQYVTKAYVDAAATGPNGWTCIIRSGANGATSTATCSGAEKAIIGGCSSATTTTVHGHPTNQGWYCQAPSSTAQAFVNCCL